ncbi:Signal transduction response regulator, receiver region domain protein [Candidatus Magnetomorum sp. HK-1]|nr:Signal transduction response regulator, receiver region domain protein [Candidatus Magnetomorum sp. HK-1]
MNNSKYHVLILNEDPLDLEDYRLLLSKSGYEVSCFHEPLTAFNEISKGNYDVALLDFNMTETYVMEVAQKLKKYVTQKNSPIIFLSTLNPKKIHRDCYLSGIDYIQKPIRSDELMDRIDVWAKQSHQLKQLEKENLNKEKIIQDYKNEISYLESISQILQESKNKQSDTYSKFKDIICNHLLLLKQKNISWPDIKKIIKTIERKLNLMVSKVPSNINQYHLTKTELKIASMIKEDLSTKEIATLMDISTSTIETHRKNIRKKIGLKNKHINLADYLKDIESNE